jgi:hypothetical protein
VWQVILVEIFVEGLSGEIVPGIPQGVQIAFSTAHGSDVAPVRLRVSLVVRPARVPQGGVVVEDCSFQPLGVHGHVPVLERITNIIYVEVQIVLYYLFVFQV